MKILLTSPRFLNAAGWAALLTAFFWTMPQPGEGAEETAWQAGFSKVVITPDEPMFMSGYAGRTAPSEGKVHDLYGRAIALRDPQGTTVVVVGTDLIGVPAEMARIISEAVEKQHQLPRGQIMFTCSHTHCGPALDDGLSKILAMSPEEAAKIPKYQAILNAKLIELIGAALADLQPSQLAVGMGHAEFATNRRPPIGTGPIDQDVPVLRVLSADGKEVRGYVFGYACHNTTLGFQQFCGDYAGFACLYLEDRHPGATALFWLGCGGDQNPLPRRKLELAEKYGRMLGVAVEQASAGEMQPLTGKLEPKFDRVRLDYERIPSKEEFETQAKGANRYVASLARDYLEKIAREEKLPTGYDYPVQVWQLGDQVTWVALGGEIVVDYSIRIKEELGRGRTWVTGYANDVMAYIPSERVLKEGGYEGESSMVYYQIPSKWAPGLEDKIVTIVRQLAGEKKP